MAREPLPLFLERSSYRRRRMMDALKLVVFLGIILWMIPMVWPSGDDAGSEPLALSRALFYIFGVWALLIVLSVALVRVLKKRPVPDADFEAEP